MSLEKRVGDLEENDRGQAKPTNPYGGRDWVLKIQYVKTICDGEERREVTLAATYPAVDWDKVHPQANGDRVAVLYPIKREPTPLDPLDDPADVPKTGQMASKESTDSETGRDSQN